MDLGALELQIFVSLVVVLGSAFVALICDYLKGNNEQLRERNIELRVRTEERERFAILNPSAWLSQFRSSAAVAAPAAEPVAPVAAESVMQSHATAEGLAQVAQREASLANRVEYAEDALAEAPPVAGFDVSERRRSRRKRGMAAEKGARSGENSYDWVRPEVMARVARRAGGGQREEEVEVPEVAAETEWSTSQLAAPVEVEKPMAAPIPELPSAVAFHPLERQTEVEQITQTRTRPASTPPVIMLRPLPAMKLADELQRIAEAAQAAQPSYTSQLLEDVIAASSAKPSAMAVPEEIVTPVVAEPDPVFAGVSFADSTPAAAVSPVVEELVVEEQPESELTAVPSFSVAAEMAAPLEMAPAVVTAFDFVAETPEVIDVSPAVVEPVAEEPETVFASPQTPIEIEAETPVAEIPPVFGTTAPAPVMEESEAAYLFTMPEFAGSALADVLMTPNAGVAEPPPFVEELPFPAMPATAHEETPVVAEPSPAFELAFPTYDSLPPVAETPAYDWSGAEFAPLPETVFASEAFASEAYPDLPAVEPVAVPEPVEQPYLVGTSAEPAVAANESFSELLLPTGMQDLATYRRLLEMPNPMSGIVITISITDFTRLSATVSEKELPALLDSVEVLMSSMVRDGDFGVKVATDQWVFVYRIDDNGFSQRRVAGLSEKLWDFQLRHLGLSNISFSWAAVNVHAERLTDAVTAAVERMEVSRRGTKKSGADRARLVVNG
jgi:hypothetical protein